MAALQSGYAATVGSTWGTSDSQRDVDGFVSHSANWAHSMAVIGYRPASTTQSGRRGFLIWNSWGSRWLSRGGVWPRDMPKGSFWISEMDMLGCIQSRDTFAFAGYEGFQERADDLGEWIDWEVD